MAYSREAVDSSSWMESFAALSFACFASALARATMTDVFSMLRFVAARVFLRSLSSDLSFSTSPESAAGNEGGCAEALSSVFFKTVISCAKFSRSSSSVSEATAIVASREAIWERRSLSRAGSAGGGREARVVDSSSFVAMSSSLSIFTSSWRALSFTIWEDCLSIVAIMFCLSTSNEEVVEVRDSSLDCNSPICAPLEERES
mmetsp:Transcript_12386/g.25317  ORF Transcript_12386/g.25317 Transcript_12386/m.25317 type:complete len:203 (-) Transcript_12386:196-804(-)